MNIEYTDSRQCVNGLIFYPMKNDKILKYKNSLNDTTIYNK